MGGVGKRGPGGVGKRGPLGGKREPGGVGKRGPLGGVGWGGRGSPRGGKRGPPGGCGGEEGPPGGVGKRGPPGGMWGRGSFPGWGKEGELEIQGVWLHGRPGPASGSRPGPEVPSWGTESASVWAGGAGGAGGGRRYRGATRLPNSAGLVQLQSQQGGEQALLPLLSSPLQEGHWKTPCLCALLPQGRHARSGGFRGSVGGGSGPPASLARPGDTGRGLKDGGRRRWGRVCPGHVPPADPREPRAGE